MRQDAYFLNVMNAIYAVSADLNLPDPQPREMIVHPTEGISLDLTKPPARTYDVPSEVYFTEADLLKPLSQDVDHTRATRLRHLGGEALAAQVADVKRVELADMASRFISTDDARRKAYREGTLLIAVSALSDFTVVDVTTDLPPTAIDDAIELLDASDFFTGIRIETLERRRTIDERLVTLGTVSDTTREYAVYGYDRYNESYLLARWGAELPSMDSLTAIQAAQCAEKDMAKLAEVNKLDEKEQLIAQYQTRHADAWRKAKRPVLAGAGFVAAGILGIVFLSVLMCIAIAFGGGLLLLGACLSGTHLHEHGQVETVHKIYDGYDRLDSITIGAGYIWRGPDGYTRVHIDKRLRD